jgi:hypothetical protein
MISCANLSPEDLILKKMLYLFITHYATSVPDLALLAINQVRLGGQCLNQVEYTCHLPLILKCGTLNFGVLPHPHLSFTHPVFPISPLIQLHKDCCDQDPTVRGLALRTLCSLRVPNFLEYVVSTVSAECGIYAMLKNKLLSIWIPWYRTNGFHRIIVHACRARAD